METRSGMAEGMEFAILAAGIGPTGQRVEQRLIECAAAEARVQLLRIHADEDRLMSLGDDFAGKIPCRSTPKGKDRFEPHAGHVGGAPVTHVLQQDVTEGDMRHARVGGASGRTAPC